MLGSGKLETYTSPVATGSTSYTPVDPETSEWGTAPTKDRITIKFCECLAQRKCKVLDAADTAHVVLVGSQLVEVDHVASAEEQVLKHQRMN